MNIQLNPAMLPEHMQFAFTPYFINETRAGYRFARRYAHTGTLAPTSYGYLETEAGKAYINGMIIHDALNLTLTVGENFDIELTFELVNTIRKAAELSAANPDQWVKALT
jgi:hypothetical protein